MLERKGILSLSGGLDSSTLLSEFKHEIAACVFFNYGSRQNDREIISAENIANHYSKPLYKIDVSQSFFHFKSALLKHSEEEVEKGRYSDKETCNALVPFRNGIFISYLVGLAESLGLDTIFLAVHAGDHRIYPDCTPSFIQRFDYLVNGYNPNISIEAPFINKSKQEIAQIALANNLPIEDTYSCYTGNMEPCGKCPTCIERIEALGLFQGRYYGRV